jgi:hypothetical protein
VQFSDLSQHNDDDNLLIGDDYIEVSGPNGAPAEGTGTLREETVSTKDLKVSGPDCAPADGNGNLREETVSTEFVRNTHFHLFCSHLTHLSVSTTMTNPSTATLPSFQPQVVLSMAITPPFAHYLITQLPPPQTLIRAFSSQIFHAISQSHSYCPSFAVEQ